MTSAIPLGIIEAPRGWEIQTQLDLIEPPVIHAAPMTLNSKTDAPRANLVIRRTPTSSHLQAVVAELIDDIAAACPGCRTEGAAGFLFDDGAEGVALTVHFDAMRQYRVVQRHIVRVDRGVLTHLTLTVDEPSRAKLDAELSAIARSFQPPEVSA